MWRGDPGFLGQDFDKKRREILTMAESGRFYPLVQTLRSNCLFLVFSDFG